MPTRVRAPLWTAAGVLAAVLALRLRDPHQHGSWGLCPFKLLTGWDCPGCGGLRAVNDLTHGSVGAAFHSNAVFVSAIPLLVAAWLYWLCRAWTGGPVWSPSPLVRRGLIVAGVVVLAAFTLWRNTPWGAAFHVV